MRVVPMVEYYGGPWDRATAYRKESVEFEVVFSPREELPDGRHRVGLARGIYQRDAQAVEGRDVDRMHWHEGNVSDELRMMEGRIVGRPTALREEGQSAD